MPQRNKNIIIFDEFEEAPLIGYPHMTAREAVEHIYSLNVWDGIDQLPDLERTRLGSLFVLMLEKCPGEANAYRQNEDLAS